MGINNFKKEDLVGRSLERLLEEIDSLSKDGSVASYQKLEVFINELAKITADATVKVAKRTGKQTMEIRDDEIELIATIKQVTDKINEGIDGNEANTAQHAAREVLRKTIAGTVGVLLKEDEIMKALVDRGVTNAEFIKNAEDEITRSQDKVKALEPTLAEKKALKDAFGKTIYLETTKSYMQKSQLDELKHDKAAAELLVKVQDKLEELRKLQDGAKSMDPASPTYTTDFGNNQVAMDVLLADVKGLAGNLKALGLRTAPIGAPADRKTQDIDFKYLELLDKGSNFITAKSTTKKIATNPDVNKTIEQLIQEDYANIKETMKRDFAKYGFASEAEVDALTNDQVDAKLASIEQEFNKVNDEINYEKAYQEQTRVAMDRFKAKTDRETELAGKFREVTKTRRVQQRDADGNLVVDADGNPVMIDEPYTEHEPTDDARRDYLATAGIADEAAYKQSKVDAARLAEEAAVNGLSRADKRDLIRRAYQRDGEWHPIKWIRSQFFTGSMWDNEYKNTYLTGKVSAAESAALTAAEAELKTKIETVAKKDLSDRKTLTAEIGLVRDAYRQAIASAVSQEKMTDELYNGQSETHVREGAMRAGMNHSLNLVDAAELAIASKRLAAHEITLEEFNRIQTEKAARDLKKVKMDPKTNQDRSHADDVANPNTSRKPQTPTYEQER